MNKLALAITQLVLILGLMEGGARLAEWLHPIQPDMSFRYAPYRMLRMEKAPWPLNHDGFRALEWNQYRDRFLVEFLGGSVCAGVGTNPGKTLPERLEDAMIQAGLGDAAVVNLCQGGATSAQELAIFTEYGLPLAPQVVISFDGANDLLHPQPVGDDWAPNLPYRNAEIQAKVDGDGEWLGHIAAVRVAARLAGHWRSGAAGLGSARHAGVPTRAIIESYLYTLDLTRTLAESRGAFYAVILQPTLHVAKPWSPEESAMWRARRPEDGPETSRISAERYQTASTELARWNQQTHVPVYDLTHAFELVPKRVYSDSVHFSGPLGYTILFEQIVSRGLLERITGRYRSWAMQRAPAVSAKLRTKPRRSGGEGAVSWAQPH